MDCISLSLTQNMVKCCLPYSFYTIKNWPLVSSEGFSNQLANRSSSLTPSIPSQDKQTNNSENTHYSANSSN